jgi:hypothetical protein
VFPARKAKKTNYASKKELVSLKVTNEILDAAQADGAVNMARLKSEHAVQMESGEGQSVGLVMQLKRLQEKVSRD